MADMVRVEWKVVVIPTEVIRCMIDAHPTPTEVVTWVDLDRCVDPIPILGAIPMLEMEVTPTPDIHKPPTPPMPEQPTAQGTTHQVQVRHRLYHRQQPTKAKNYTKTIHPGDNPCC